MTGMAGCWPKIEVESDVKLAGNTQSDDLFCLDFFLLDCFHRYLDFVVGACLG